MSELQGSAGEFWTKRNDQNKLDVMQIIAPRAAAE